MSGGLTLCWSKLVGGLPSAGDGGRDDAARQAVGQNLFLVSIVCALFNSFI
jgi:hypothetical protein